MLSDLNDRQLESLRELRIVASSLDDNSVEILSEDERDGILVIRISLDCAGIKKSPGGLPLRMRESFTIRVVADYPYVSPGVFANHTRWAGHAHIQWGSYLCLYQAPNTEWDPSDGMFGFLDRLWLFLSRGASNELDMIGGPRHPPIAYPTGNNVPTVLVRADTPRFDNQYWLGVAEVSRRGRMRADITGWSELKNARTCATESCAYAAAFLLSEPFPFEYPRTVSDLLAALASKGVPTDLWILLLQCVALRLPKDQPLLVVLGTPMRGTKGEEPVQHLAVWHLESWMASALRGACYKDNEDGQLQEIGQGFEDIVLEWARTAKMDWCSVHEVRDETTRRRDTGSPMRTFGGLHVSLLGCGALGSAISEHLVRAGVRRLDLYDNKSVSPGLLVRQRYNDDDIGRNKAQALKERLESISPDVHISPCDSNLLSVDLASAPWKDADVIINTTASKGVAIMLERQASDCLPFQISMIVGHLARRGLVIALPHSSVLSCLSALREAKLVACDNEDCIGWADEFWPQSGRTEMFQPEPGCSDATFQGAAAEIDMLASSMLLEAAQALNLCVGRMTFLSNPVFVEQSVAIARYPVPETTLLEDEYEGYRVLVNASVIDTIDATIAHDARIYGAHVETGGVLFGQRDDAAKVLWLTVATEAPKDSRRSVDGFVCGFFGIEKIAKELKANRRGAVLPVGMWHTHPNSCAVPSLTDLEGMDQLLGSNERPHRRQLLMIVGGSRSAREYRTYLFDRERIRRYMSGSMTFNGSRST